MATPLQKRRLPRVGMLTNAEISGFDCIILQKKWRLHKLVPDELRGNKLICLTKTHEIEEYLECQ